MGEKRGKMKEEGKREGKKEEEEEGKEQNPIDLREVEERGGESLQVICDNPSGRRIKKGEQNKENKKKDKK